MKLRSPCGATNISDPAKALSLDFYIKSRGVAREESFPLPAFISLALPQFRGWARCTTYAARQVTRAIATGRGFSSLGYSPLLDNDLAA